MLTRLKHTQTFLYNFVPYTQLDSSQIGPVTMCLFIANGQNSLSWVARKAHAQELINGGRDRHGVTIMRVSKTSPRPPNTFHTRGLQGDLTDYNIPGVGRLMS